MSGPFVLASGSTFYVPCTFSGLSKRKINDGHQRKGKPLLESDGGWTARSRHAPRTLTAHRIILHAAYDVTDLGLRECREVNVRSVVAQLQLVQPTQKRKDRSGSLPLYSS